MEEPQASSPMTENASLSNSDVEEKVYVAVGKEFKESLSTLVWVIRDDPNLKKLFLAHIHQPADTIPMMGGRFKVSQLSGPQVSSFRQEEREKMEKALDKYESFCKSFKIQVEKVVIEMDDIAKGLLELITCNGITKLVMAAAADKHYSRKMKAPKSKTALAVQKEAPSSCKIWFVCKENLICVREASPNGTTLTSTSSTQTNLEPERWKSMSLSHSGQSSNRARALERRSRSHIGVLHREENKNTVPEAEAMVSPPSQRRLHDLNSLQAAESSSSSWREEDVPPTTHDPDEDPRLSSSQGNKENINKLSDALHHQLKQAVSEAANSNDEAHAESCSRSRAGMVLIDAIRRAKKLESRYTKEKKMREEMEAMFEREKLEMENLKTQHEEVSGKLQHVYSQKSAVEIQILDSDDALKYLEENLSSAKHLLHLIQREKEELQKERDDAIREARELQNMKEEASSSTSELPKFLHFSYMELQEATRNFESLLKIGEGGYGSVYKGYIHDTSVAIKMLHPQNLHGQSEFYQEVDILSRVRHPNLVTLVGVCAEAWAIVYEFLPNGSLEDRLTCKEGSPPLSCQVRTRIAYEICSALVFLHSAKPHSVVHGDLKPANILLDANFVSKLSDFGISRLLIDSTTSTPLFHETDPKGTLVYMDPEFLSTGELTPRSDVYSFGIVLLRLLTGKPALGIVNKVQEAVDTGSLQEVLDPTAGDWPMMQALQLAYLGIRCCEMNRKNRPDLVDEIWRLFKLTRNDTPSSQLPLLLSGPSFSSARLSFSSPRQSFSSSDSSIDEKGFVPSYFICPIFQKAMTDPCIAADGYSYEAEAIKKWFELGNVNSPKTKLRLAHNQLTPNHALRSAIQEWAQQRQA